MSKGKLFALPLLLVALAGLAGLSSAGVEAQSPRTLTIRAGGGADGNWVNLFLPDSATISTGETIRWIVPSAEPHSITFILGQPPEVLPVSTSPASIPDDAPVINSDLIFGGNPENPPSFEATFTAAGTYEYFCFIHPFMTGTIEVLDPGDAGSAGIDNQGSLDARGDAAEYSATFEGAANDAAIKSRIPAAKALPGGAREYGVILGGETRDTQQNIMYPKTLTVRPGDSVRFINETVVPHSATFGQLPPGDPFAAPATANTDPTTGIVHTGLLAVEADPSGGTKPVSTVLKFSKAGTYDYYCLLHPEMQGQVVVSASAAPGAPNTGSGTVSPGANGTSVYLLLGAVMVAFMAAGSMVIASRRG
jgi:plastocyanin